MANPQLPAPAPTSARPVYPSDRTRSLRRRKQRESQKDERQQRYANIAQRLMNVIEDLSSGEDTDLRAELQRLVHRVRQRGASNEQKDHEQVMEAILHHGCHCVEDINDHTGIPKANIWKILDGFVSNGQLEERNGQSTGTRQRDEIDTLYYPTGSPGFSSLVRP
jgi:DNA topoisomerase VI subunit B